MTETSTLFGAVTVQDVDLAAWGRAWAAWLGRKSANTQRAYRRAWDDLLAFSDRPPWEIASSDLEAWLVDLRARGLAAATLGQRLAAVRSFYSFVSGRYLVPCPAGEKPLHHYNPAASVEAPKVERYTEAVYLSGEQVRALFRAIPRDTAIGLRNYALLLAYVATARRSAEIRTLRWGDLRADGSQVRFHWKNKGQSRWDEIPADVWEAIRDYLAAVDRLGSMAPADYIFTALEDHAGRFPHLGEDYQPTSRPISGPEVVRILRSHARAAGIQVDGLVVHSLRHTSAMLWKALGMDTKEIQEQLGHSTLKTTDHYLHTLEGGRNAGWARVRDYLKL